MLRDEITLTVESGRGGDGCLAFHREKFRPKGGPSGGDGGRGGDVVFVASPDVHGFFELRGRRVVRAKKGVPGGNLKRHGRNMQALEITVPVGTEVRDAETGVMLRDLLSPGDRVTVVKGGRGGKGNARFATATNQVPRKAEQGGDAERRKLSLTLKLIADAGLVGLPNAGKSTLLARVSGSRSRSGAYQFTTLGPHLGVVELSAADRITIADLPGLIEGAHQGRGLGGRFLKHVERTRLLVHVVARDPLEPPEAVAQAYRTIRDELAAYSADLAAKPEIVVLTKSDLGGVAEAHAALAAESGAEVLVVSAVSGEGLPVLLAQIARRVVSGDDEFGRETRAGDAGPAPA